MARKPLSKKLRFEVFKRDSFTCQYCGVVAPDVILHVDHICPVSAGGDNDITNLITSCQECNSGKGARTLDDDSTLAKQRVQLEELNARRLQLEMMLEWRAGLKQIDTSQVEAIANEFSKRTSAEVSVNERGIALIRKWLKKYSVPEILDALDKSVAQYVVLDEHQFPTQESVEKAFHYIPRIASVTRRPEHERQLLYIRGILRNRLHYINENECLSLLKRAYEADASLEGLFDLARDIRNWTQWQGIMHDFLASQRENGDGA